MNILLLCTYPIGNPMHGGQLRVRNIVDIIRSAGHSVEVVGVLGSESYEREGGYLEFPGVNVLSKYIKNPFLMEDYDIGKIYSEDEYYYKCLSSEIKFKPDIFHVEQPWLFEFSFKYRNRSAPNAKIVYGSQNIEWILKKDIVSSYIDAETSYNYSELIKEVEIKAVTGADCITCVSGADAAWLSSKTDRPVVLVPNGVKEWKTTSEGFEEAEKVSKGYRYALYCASAHPPNIAGFFDIFGGGFGSLKPDEKMVIAGGAGWSIAGDERVHRSAKLAEKIVIAGMVTQSCLEGLLDQAHCIVLPLTQGGGTNLKTAEALWAGKHIVATSIAMRGFERFIGSNGVQVANDSVSFKRAVRNAMAAEPIKLSDAEIEERRAVLWGSCLTPLVENLIKLT